MGKLSNQISNSNDIAAVVLNSLDTGISIDTLLEISKNYSVDECLNLERKFKYLSDNIINKQYIDNFAKLVVSDNNTKLDDLYGAVILSNITGKDYSWSYEKADYQYSNKGVTDYKLYIKNSETKDFKSVIHETYEYNNLKQLSQLTHSDITSPDEILTSTYSYGIAGELLNKKVTGTSIEQNVTYKYNKAGQNTEILNIGKLASGVVADYPDETTFSEKYAYDLGGNLTEKISNNKTVKNSSVLNQKQSQTSYTYDSLNRLTKE